MNEIEKERAILSFLELMNNALVNENLLSDILTEEEKVNLFEVFGQLLGDLINTTGGKIYPLMLKLKEGEISDSEKMELKALVGKLKILLARVFCLLEFTELSI